MDRFLSAAKTFHERHERLKNHVHTAWRYPLPPWGRAIMGFVYFSIPVVGGYAVMQWAISKSHASIGERGEKLQVKRVQGLGDKRLKNGEVEKVGAGGRFGGVHLAVSDEQTQENNKVMLEAFFREQRKKRRKQQKQVEHGQEEDS